MTATLQIPRRWLTAIARGRVRTQPRAVVLKNRPLRSIQNRRSRCREWFYHSQKRDFSEFPHSLAANQPSKHHPQQPDPANRFLQQHTRIRNQKSKKRIGACSDTLFAFLISDPCVLLKETICGIWLLWMVFRWLVGSEAVWELGKVTFLRVVEPFPAARSSILDRSERSIFQHDRTWLSSHTASSDCGQPSPGYLQSSGHCLSAA